MATIINYLSLEGLSKYDAKIKAFIDAKVTEGDAKSFKFVHLENGVLKFYTTNPITENAVADFEIELPEQDLSHLMQLVEDAKENNVAIFDANGQVVDSNLAVADIATKAEVEAVQDSIDELSAYVGEIPDGYSESTIVSYINKKAEETLNAASGGSSESAASVLAALNTYKAENDPKVAANTAAAEKAQGDVDALTQTHATDKAALEAKDAELAGAITAEKERAEGIEADFEERIATMEVFWDATEDSDEVVNTLKEIQDYIASDETGAATMAGNIQANTQAIADMDTAYKAADEALSGRIATLEAIDHDAYVAADTALKTELEGKINVKADASALTDAVAALEGADSAQVERIAALEAKFDGEGSVDSKIATAKQEAIDAAKQYADEEDAKIEGRVEALETASATHALKSEVEAVAGRATDLETDMAQAKIDIDAVEAQAAANKTAHEANAAAVATKAEQSALEAEIARAKAAEEANAAAISAFTEITEEEINALFA